MERQQGELGLGEGVAARGLRGVRVGGATRRALAGVMISPMGCLVPSSQSKLPWYSLILLDVWLGLIGATLLLLWAASRCLRGCLRGGQRKAQAAEEHAKRE